MGWINKGKGSAISYYTKMVERSNKLDIQKRVRSYSNYNFIFVKKSRYTIVSTIKNLTKFCNLKKATETYGITVKLPAAYTK